MITNTSFGRRSVALAVATVALTGIFLGGAAEAANAEMDPNNGPAQSIPFDEPGTGVGGNWTTSSWVADKYTYVDRNLVGFDFYKRIDGTAAPASDADIFRRNYGYSWCTAPWWTDQLMCHN